MKQVGTDLETYLDQTENINSCDLYELVLDNGNHYYFADTDTDITWQGNVYTHKSLEFKRQQVKTNSNITVDSMTINVYTDTTDTFEAKTFLKAAHDGSLDKAKLYLKRCFWEGETIIGVLDLFGGNVEVKSAGGIQVQLTVKAKTQGLNMEFPMRKYYPQGFYTVGSDNVISETTDQNTCLIAPFVPLKEVLL